MFEDNRGKLFFPIKQNNFTSYESIVSINKLNVFRGIHVETFPKLITCIQGRFLDIVINFNENDNDYLIPKYYNLNTNDGTNQLLVPSNYGHAFISLEEQSIMLYNYGGIYNTQTTKVFNYKDPIFNMDLSTNIIISEKDKFASFYKPIDYYILGHRGFIGGEIVNQLRNMNKTSYLSKLRLENVSDIKEELKVYKPKHVICSAGITGTPNISWCETNRESTIETNIVYQMTLVHLCSNLQIHLIIIGSGVIFKNDRFYTEEEEGNFNGNFYGRCRIILENMAKEYKNVMYVRINYPISKTYSDKNLITKLLRYSTINETKITLTYIDELVPYLLDMVENYATGICNLVNKDVISLTDIMKIYSSRVPHHFIMSETNDDKKTASLLQIGKLEQYNVKTAFEAVNECVNEYIKLNVNKTV
jgi:dTDP-4-dehydrorhamnose 3,5-epimerase-like enzyme/dTDP-4-dehydrorhamnose reductase